MNLEKQTASMCEAAYPPLIKKEEPLSRVVGHEDQKKELLLVVDWFKHSKELKEKGLSVVKGVVLFGQPGNGKSMMIKEIIKYLDCPTFIFKGDKENICGGIIKVFNEAKEAGHAVIVIDELDLLINRDPRLTRTLQECLDGVESSDDILVLTATNKIKDVPDALKRSGRLEKLIHIPYAKGDEALALLKRYFEELKVELLDELDEEELVIALDGLEFADIKSIANDIALRNGFVNITEEMIFESIHIITNKVKSKEKESPISVCTHESAHAVMAHAFPQHFIIKSMKVNGANGTFSTVPTNEDDYSYNKTIASIKVSMAGILAEKIICKKGSRGCESDLDSARSYAYNLFNRCGYSSCWETLPPMERTARTDTFIKRRRMERKIERFLRKLEREVTRYIKSHRKVIQELAMLLQDKKYLKSSEILSVIG